jgi:hypothetical protein
MSEPHRCPAGGRLPREPSRLNKLEIGRESHRLAARRNGIRTSSSAPVGDGLQITFSQVVAIRLSPDSVMPTFDRPQSLPTTRGVVVMNQSSAGRRVIARVLRLTSGGQRMAAGSWSDRSASSRFHSRVAGAGRASAGERTRVVGAPGGPVRRRRGAWCCQMVER